MQKKQFSKKNKNPYKIDFFSSNTMIIFTKLNQIFIIISIHYD